MRRKEKLPELLSPAGDKQSLIAAIAAGADAVYIGGKRFGARAYAKNFDISEIKEAVRLCHINGVRLYVTVNTLIYPKEMDALVSYAEELYLCGVDAVIITDLGAISQIRKRVPALELHASTQMGIHNSVGADEAYALGCKRVVLARECSGESIKEIVEKSKCECEVFLHGALCVCHSGQCLFSSMVGGRSGNRGECAQPCRLPYGGKYPLSLKDLCLASHIEELIASGVSSLKIEGRMKSPEYVYGVTQIYRRLLDEKRSARRDEISRLEAIFSRGGFTDGYFRNKLAAMTGIRSESDKDSSRSLDIKVSPLQRLPIKASVKIKRSEQVSLTMTVEPMVRHGNTVGASLSVTCEGDMPQEAINAPLTAEGVKERIAKMGSTPFSLDTCDIAVELDSGLNLSPAAINSLRRECAQRLESLFEAPLSAIMGCADFEPVSSENSGKSEIDGTRVNFYDKNSQSMPEILSTARFYDQRVFHQWQSEGGNCEFDIVFLPLYDFSPSSLPENARCGVSFPFVIMENELDGVISSAKRAKECGAEYALVSNLSHFRIARQAGLKAYGDIRLNITNRFAYESYKSLGAVDGIVSPELNLAAVKSIGGACLTMGRIPLMITERCFVKETFGCDSCMHAVFTDRRGEKFPILRDHPHRNLIFNSRITYMGDKTDELSAYGIKKTHVIFTTETAKEVKSLVGLYRSRASLPYEVRRIGKR